MLREPSRRLIGVEAAHRQDMQNTDIAEAPRDGTVIEALSDGDWYQVYWSESAYDGSPYGSEGWKDRFEGLLVLDLEAWRAREDHEVVDEAGDLRRDADEAEAALSSELREERKRLRQVSRQRTAEKRSRLERRLSGFTGEHIATAKLPLRTLEARLRPLEAQHMLDQVGAAMKSFAL